MKVKFAFFGLIFAVSSLMATSLQIPDQYFLLDTSEMKFLRSLDAIHAEQPEELDFLFLSGFGLFYQDWKKIFLDEVESDLGIYRYVDEKGRPSIEYIGRHWMVTDEPVDGSE